MSRQGHFNPTFQDVANPTPGEPSTYEIGDLSGKHGRLIPTADTGNTADPTRLVVRETYTDTTASILYNPTAGSKGSMWIVGRSIVIHNADGSRWVCANIGSPGIGTTVIFPSATGQPSGSVELFQPSLFWDTAMAVNLVGLEGGNKWHVHVYPVPGSGDCGGTGGYAGAGLQPLARAD
jgi:hypothetical protein